MQNVRHSRNDTLPTRHEGYVHRLARIEEFLARTEDIFGEDFDGGTLCVAIVFKSVDRGVAVIALDQIKCDTVVSSFDCAYSFVGKNLPLRRHLTIKRLGNITTHLGEAASTIFKRKLLVLMIIGISDIDLANLVGRIIALHLREHTHFQAPVGGDTNIFDHVLLHSKLARERIVEAVEVFEVFIRTTDLLERANKRRNE